MGVNERKQADTSRRSNSDKMLLMRRLKAIVVFFAILVLRPFDALAWNIPGHMLSGAIG
jgi:hypothetical protein